MDKRTSGDSSRSFEKEIHFGSLFQQFSISFYFVEQHFVQQKCTDNAEEIAEITKRRIK